MNISHVTKYYEFWTIINIVKCSGRSGFVIKTTWLALEKHPALCHNDILYLH